MKYLQSIFIIVFILLTNLRGMSNGNDSLKAGSDSVIVNSDHPKMDPVEKGFVIYSDSGKSYLRIRGEIRLNGSYDFRGLQAQTTFNVYQIPVDSNNIPDGRFYMGVFQSRFGIEAKMRTQRGDLFLKLEGDFLGNNNNFRIRQAYGKLNSFLLGKTRTLFSDPEAMPSKVDREGPNFSLSERTIQARFEPAVKNSIKWGVALETPDPDISNPDSAEVSPYYQAIPEIVSQIKLEFSNGEHIQLAGIFRNITVRNLNGDLQIIQGYGGLFSGKFNILKKNNLKYQLYYGRAMARYVKALKGEGLDVIFDNIENVYKPVTTYGGFASFYHQWCDFLFSDFTIGAARIVNIDSQPVNSFKYGYYGSANLFCRTFKESELGFEYSYGQRIDMNGNAGTAERLSFIVFYYF